MKKAISELTRKELEKRYNILYTEALRLSDLVIKYEDVEMAMGYDFLGLKASIADFIECREYDEAGVFVEVLGDLDEVFDKYFEDNPDAREKDTVKFVRDELVNVYITLNSCNCHLAKDGNGRTYLENDGDGTLFKYADDIPTKFSARLVLDDYRKRNRWSPVNL